MREPVIVHACTKCGTVPGEDITKQIACFYGSSAEAEKKGWKFFYWGGRTGRVRGIGYWLCPEHANDPYPGSHP